MSHFSVLVVTATKPSHDQLAGIMQPWHEYESTGIKDRYVVDVDITDDLRADHAKYGDGQPFADFVEGWSHAEKRGDRYFRFTNPNAKWDWWTVGGRWTGMLHPLYDPATDPKNTEICSICRGTGMRMDNLGISARAQDPSYTCNGCNGQKVRTKWPTEWSKFDGDQMRRGDIQLDALRTDAEQRAAERYDAFNEAVAGRPVPDFDALRDAHGIEEARKIYHADPVIQALYANEALRFSNLDRFKVDRATFLADARNRALQSFAVVKDGHWYERGKMGWWALTSREVEPEVWDSQFSKLVEELPSDTWLTVVDCHI